jgi:hypothetical protein
MEHSIKRFDEILAPLVEEWKSKEMTPLSPDGVERGNER